MGLADFYHQNGCTDIESKITALEKRLKQHPWVNMDRKKRLMMLEKEYCKLGAYHQKVAQEKPSKNKYADIYAQMQNNQNSAYNKYKDLPPEQIQQMQAQEMIRSRFQFYGKEYYTPR
jgi:hypothetical protein